MPSRNSIISTACGFVLSMGAVVILVLISGPFALLLPPSVQVYIPFSAFIVALLVIMPPVAQRLNKLDGIHRITGWTLIGIGAEFLVFPVSLLFGIISAPSPGAALLPVVIAFSVVLGATAGLTCILVGMLLIKRRRYC